MSLSDAYAVWGDGEGGCVQAVEGHGEGQVGHFDGQVVCCLAYNNRRRRWEICRSYRAVGSSDVRSVPRDSSCGDWGACNGGVVVWC